MRLWGPPPPSGALSMVKDSRLGDVGGMDTEPTMRGILGSNTLLFFCGVFKVIPEGNGQVYTASWLTR